MSTNIFLAILPLWFCYLAAISPMSRTIASLSTPQPTKFFGFEMDEYVSIDPKIRDIINLKNMLKLTWHIHVVWFLGNDFTEHAGP